MRAIVNRRLLSRWAGQDAVRRTYNEQGGTTQVVNINPFQIFPPLTIEFLPGELYGSGRICVEDQARSCPRLLDDGQEEMKTSFAEEYYQEN
jgi:hypothetical protein